MQLIMVCSDVCSGELAAEVYEKLDESKGWIGFIMDKGEAGMLSASRTDRGFSSTKGVFHNLRLLQKQESIYELSLYTANIDGSDGEAVIATKDVLCVTAD